MEKKMLVKRKRGAHDRRVVKVNLTAKGKNMQEQLSSTKKEIFERITHDLSLREINHLVTLLEKMMKNVEREELLNSN